MNNSVIETVVDKSDRWFVHDERVVLLSLTGVGIKVGERIASFPLENLTDENWETIEQLQEVEALSDEK